MKLTVLLGAAALVLSTPAFAQPQMTAGEFLVRAEPLLKKNKAALLFSGEARKLAKVIRHAAERNRARHEAEQAAGRRLSACLPPKGKAKIEAGELMGYLRSLSPTQRAQSFEQAFAGAMTRKYACKR